jgi:hypothetical protein
MNPRLVLFAESLIIDGKVTLCPHRESVLKSLCAHSDEVNGLANKRGARVCSVHPTLELDDRQA